MPQDKNCFGRRTQNKKTTIQKNLRKYRGQKISKGQRRIRTQRYFYQPKDIVIYNGKKYVVKGVQNKGNYIKLEKLNKPVKVSLVKPYEFRKGFCAV